MSEFRIEAFVAARWWAERLQSRTTPTSDTAEAVALLLSLATHQNLGWQPLSKQQVARFQITLQDTINGILNWDERVRGSSGTEVFGQGYCTVKIDYQPDSLLTKCFAELGVAPKHYLPPKVHMEIGPGWVTVQLGIEAPQQIYPSPEVIDIPHELARLYVVAVTDADERGKLESASESSLSYLAELATSQNIPDKEKERRKFTVRAPLKPLYLSGDHEVQRAAAAILAYLMVTAHDTPD